jgi:DNA-binding transcriptional LysR family regulator
MAIYTDLDGSCAPLGDAGGRVAIQPVSLGGGLAVPLDVRAAEVFVAVAEELHFGRAAGRVHMTQPAVSRHITRLEASLGVMLLQRTNRHVELTPEGEVFLGGARDVIAAARRAVETAQLAARGAVGELRVGSAGLLPNELALRVVRAFRRRYLDVDVLLSQFSHQTRPLAGLDRRQTDVAFVRAPVLAGMRFAPLIDEPRVAVLGAAHPLAKRQQLTLAALSREPVVTSAAWPQRIRDYWAGVDDGADATYAVAIVTHGLGEWLAALADGKGWSLCPRSIAAYYERDGLVFGPVEGLGHGTIGLAWRSDHDVALVVNFVRSAGEYVAAHSLGGWTPSD